jgi:hypothetical protein
MPWHARALLAVAIMLVAASWAVASEAVLPPALVGEWVTTSSDFDAGALAAGTVVYLRADGLGTLIAAPPLLGVAGHATWDERGRTLTLSVTRPGRRITVCPLVWEPTASTLTDESGLCARAPFTRRRARVPGAILEAFQALD